MHISQLMIKNYKSIARITIEFDSKFNVLIGRNNVGKTTIIEAMLLWKKCYDINVVSKGKKFYSVSKNLNFADIESLRVSDDKDVFHTLSGNNKAELELVMRFSDEDENYKLGFKVTKAGHINNAYFQISYLCPEEFTRFASLTEKYGKSLRNLIMFTETRPISKILSFEPYILDSREV